MGSAEQREAELSGGESNVKAPAKIALVCLGIWIILGGEKPMLSIGTCVCTEAVLQYKLRRRGIGRSTASSYAMKNANEKEQNGEGRFAYPPKLDEPIKASRSRQILVFVRAAGRRAVMPTQREGSGISIVILMSVSTGTE